MIPIVNVDSFRLMCQHFKKTNWTEIKEIRKNRRVFPNCPLYQSGVDLNRNYDIKFDYSSSGASTDRCDESYRGATPFSEPETQAIRHVIEITPAIVSALNFHSYANLWIHPYNYNSDKKNDILHRQNERLWRAYKDFERRASFAPGVK